MPICKGAGAGCVYCLTDHKAFYKPVSLKVAGEIFHGEN